jgi:hypothetical protein
MAKGIAARAWPGTIDERTPILLCVPAEVFQAERRSGYHASTPSYLRNRVMRSPTRFFDNTRVTRLLPDIDTIVLASLMFARRT